MTLPDILPMTPYLREMIWGGRGLQTHFHKNLPPGKSIGESWEMSAYREMESTVACGPLAGWSLRRLVETCGSDLLGSRVCERYAGEFPLLIKLLDARQDLSVQVHPDDGYGRAQGLGEFGKMEAWYILHSDSGRIACGLEEGVGKADVEAAVSNGRVEDVIRFFDVAPGDVVFLPPGTVHALCKGVIIYEVQQSSDLTFRIYDYNRPGPDGAPRELHIVRALDVIAFNAPAQKPVNWQTLSGAGQNVPLVESPHFRLERFSAAGGRAEHASDGSFAALTLLNGSATVAGPHDAFPAQKGDTFLIPAGRSFSATRQGNGPLDYLIASVP